MTFNFFYTEKFSASISVTLLNRVTKLQKDLYALVFQTLVLKSPLETETPSILSFFHRL